MTGACAKRRPPERGQLVAPFGFVPDGTSYHLLSRQSPEQDGRVRRLTAWLRAKTSRLENGGKPDGIEAPTGAATVSPEAG